MTSFKQQQFRVEPKDVNAREGSNVTLNCEINDVTGDVQWTKDGLALGKCQPHYANIVLFIAENGYCPFFLIARVHNVL